MDDQTPDRLRVLIVEDDRMTARDLEATLHRRGFGVAGIAHSAEGAEDILSEKEVSLVLLDIQLGEQDAESDVTPGIALAVQLRNERGLPVIFVTGYSEDAIFEKAREARPAAFLRKPFSDAELAACLEAVAERAASGEKLGARLPGIAAVSDTISQAVIASDLGGQVAYLNESASELTGWGRDDAIGTALSTVVAIENSNSEEGAKSPPGRKIITLRSRNGTLLNLEERSAPIKIDNGEAIGLITVLSENAEGADDPDETSLPQSPPLRSAALQSIAKLSQDPEFRKLLPEKPKEGPPALPVAERKDSPSTSRPPVPLIEDVSDPILKITSDGIVSYANAEAISIFASAAPIVGKSLGGIFDSVDFEPVDDAFMSPLADGRRNRFEFHDSSRNCWFEVHVYRNNGGVLALFSDVTARKSESAEAVRQQRLEGLGLLARGFAHDFNNHLTTITGNISLARERNDDRDQQAMLGEAQAAASRATGLVQQLMTFARGGRPIRERTRVSDIVRGILTEHRIQHPEIRYQFQGPDAELVANIDPAQISRLVENLVANSAEAMSSGGVLVVRCGKILPERVSAIKGTHQPTDEEHFLIEVIDTGEGISAENLGRVFEPYYSNRKEDNATGIGLTVCESIAKAHGGFVQLQSKEGKGTIASFCAPLGHAGLNEAALDTTDSPAYPNLDFSALPAGNARVPEDSLLEGTRILILEDDAPILRLMAATLRRAGHEITETKDGRETIEAYRKSMNRNETFDLVICDLTIENGVGGVETMRQIVEMDPNVLAMVSSGYSDAPAMSNPRAFGFSSVLPKPYAPSELRAAVQRLLRSRRN